MAITTNNVSTSEITITVSNPPLTNDSPGTAGSIAWDENFIYVCVSENLWARTNISASWNG